MRSLVSILLVTLVLSWTPAVLAQGRLDVATEEIESAAVGRRLKYQVVLPKDYGKQRDKSYPVRSHLCFCSRGDRARSF